MKVYPNIVSNEDVQSILEQVIARHPEVLERNTYNEDVNQDLQYLRYMPQTYLPDLDGEAICLVLLSSTNNIEDYGGREWHLDGPDDETTVLLYLQGDPNSGGEFVTEEASYKFGVGTMFVLPSDKLHRVEPYINKTARIALKWKFK